MHLNYVAIVVAAIAVFVFAAIYYTLLARQRAQLSPAAAAAGRRRPPASLMALELTKSLMVAVVVAGIASLIGITDGIGAVELGLALWVAFPVVLLIGSVTQENVPWRLGAIHAGDWLAKLLIIAVIVSLRR